MVYVHNNKVMAFEYPLFELKYKNMSRIKLQKKIIENNFKHTSQLIIETSENCNLACLYCGLRDNYIQQDSHDRNKQMDWHTVKLLLDYYIPLWHAELSGIKRFFTIGFYGGEPLLNFELIDKVYQYVEKNKPVDFSVRYDVTTNGMLLDKYIDYFVLRNFTLAVSLDGDRKANSFRVDKNGLESFDRLEHILIDIKKRYPNYFADNISFQAVMNSQNSVIDVFAYFKSVFDKRPMPLEISLARLSAKSNIHSMYKKVEDDLRISMQTRKKECEKFTLRNPDMNYLEFYLRTFTPYYIDNYSFFYSNTDNVSDRFPTSTCLPFTHKVFLTVRGLILPCERVGFDKPLGRIVDGKIDIDFQEIADFYNQIFQKYQELCKNCIRNIACKNCFYNINYGANENLCPDYESILSKDKYVKRAMDILTQNPEAYLLLVNSID